MSKQYWYCMIGPGDPSNYISKMTGSLGGADGPLRMVVREQFNDTFGEDEICSSGWGISPERFELLRKVFSLPTHKLKELLSDE